MLSKFRKTKRHIFLRKVKKPAILFYFYKKQNTLKTSFKYFFPLLVLSVSCFLFCFYLGNKYKAIQYQQIDNFRSSLFFKEKQIDQLLFKTTEFVSKNNPAELFFDDTLTNPELFSKDCIIVQVYKKDSLIFWSDNSLLLLEGSKGELTKRNIGWFWIKSKELSGGLTCLVGILIKKEYPYQNRYLKNTFPDFFSMPAESEISLQYRVGFIPILTKNNAPFFYISISEQSQQNQLLFTYYLFFLIGGIIAVLVVFQKIVDYILLKKHPIWGISCFAILLFLIRALTIYFKIPHTLYQTELFSPRFFGDANSFWLPSLGDMLINSIFIFYIISFVYKRWPPPFNLKTTDTIRIVFYLMIVLFFSWLINDWAIGLIKNSNISFELNNIFSLSIYSYVGIFTIGILLFSFFLLVDRVANFIHLTSHSFILKTSIITILFLCYIVFCHWLHKLDLIAICWPIVIFLFLFFLKPANKSSYSFSFVVLFLFLFSLYITHTFLKHSQIKEKDDRVAFAEKISAPRNQITEHLFSELEKEIVTDTNLTTFFSKNKNEVDGLKKYLDQNYFSGYWDRYEIKPYVFDSSCAPVYLPVGENMNNADYLDELILNESEPIFSTNLFFLKSTLGETNYIAKFLFEKNLHSPFSIYLVIKSRVISEEIGFPELLLEGPTDNLDYKLKYSYAKYYKKKLTTQTGNYPYTLTGTGFYKTANGFTYININGYEHLIYKINEDKVIVVSKKTRTRIEELTTFSYLFAFFSLLGLIVFLIKQFVWGWSIKRLTFKGRIQVALISIVLLSLAILGPGSVYYIYRQYENKNENFLREKAQSVLVELGSKLGEQVILENGVKNYVTYILQKFSNVFFTDINLYDKSGSLFATSRPKLFEEKLTSEKINTSAFREVVLLNKTEYTHHENIGSLDYLSTYIPFKNKEGKVLAYLNLPYFAKQDEIESEISDFLVALINIYVLLFALTVLIAVFISDYITQPLKLIQEKMSRVTLGKSNELIDWKEKDEIGSLVSEYNRMIMELSEKADQLARSEREGAWREMAKQVAHEIKNPLTPMKLNIQHLQRIWKENPEDMSQRADRVSASLIEQIDALSNIANEFSNFAKMPRANNKKADVFALLNNSIQLYKDSISIDFSSDKKDVFYCWADKEQLLRVFNNLIKNSIQAIPNANQGKIAIKLYKENQQIIVSIQDNGIGIKEEQKRNIFIPNFTTKSGGTGLGLAMCKNIIEGIGGKIWFESKEAIGATFFVSVPEFIQKN